MISPKLRTSSAAPPTIIQGLDMPTELLRWTYDRLYTLANPPGGRARSGPSRAPNGKGKGRAVEIVSDSEDEGKKSRKKEKKSRVA